MDGGASLSSAFRASLPEFIESEVVTYPSDQALGYDELERIVRAYLAGVSEPYILLAESFSGPLAIRIAANPPDRLMAIVLAATFHSSPVARWLRLLARSWLFRLPLSGWVIGRYLLGAQCSSESIEQVRDAVRAVDPKVMAMRARAILDVDVRTLLPTIALPVLNIVARGDLLVPPLVTYAVRDLRNELLDGPHFILHARPVEAARLVAEFAGEIDRLAGFGAV